jgi:hypothetical protein
MNAKTANSCSIIEEIKSTPANQLQQVSYSLKAQIENQS